VGLAAQTALPERLEGGHKGFSHSPSPMFFLQKNSDALVNPCICPIRYYVRVMYWALLVVIDLLIMVDRSLTDLLGVSEAAADMMPCGDC
jgi:hypothetical protein